LDEVLLFMVTEWNNMAKVALTPSARTWCFLICRYVCAFCAAVMDGDCSETCRKNCLSMGLAPVFGVEPLAPVFDAEPLK